MYLLALYQALPLSQSVWFAQTEIIAKGGEPGTRLCTCSYPVIVYRKSQNFRVRNILCGKFSC